MNLLNNTIKIKELEFIGEKDWDNFVKSFSQRTFFHSWAWLEFLRISFRFKPLHLGIFSNNKIVGVFPAIECQKGLLKIIASPLSGTHTAHMGPLVSSILLRETIEAFYYFFKEKHYDYVEIAFPYHLERNIFTQFDFHVQERQTYIVKLENDSDKMWKKLHIKCRSKIRKAQKSGIEIVEANQREKIVELYKMLKEVSNRRKGIPMKSLSFYYNLWDCFRKKGQLKLLFAKYKDKLVAGAIFPHDDEGVFYFSGGGYKEYLRYAPNNLIQWQIIKWASKNKLKYYNMYGGVSPEGIGRFKKSFGPEIITYTQVWKSITLRAKFGRLAYIKIYKLNQKMRYYFDKYKFLK